MMFVPQQMVCGVEKAGGQATLTQPCLWVRSAPTRSKKAPGLSRAVQHGKIS